MVISTIVLSLNIDQRTDWRTALILPIAAREEINENWLARCQIRSPIDQLIAEPRAAVLPDKSVSLELNRVETSVGAGNYFFDLLLESPSGDRQKMVKGTAIIISTATVWQTVPSAPPVIQPEVNPAWLDNAISDAIAGATYSREVLTVLSNNQVQFGLTGVPSLPHLSQFFVNGVKASFGTDYAINGSILNWNNQMQMETTDELELFYRI